MRFSRRGLLGFIGAAFAAVPAIAEPLHRLRSGYRLATDDEIAEVSRYEAAAKKISEHQIDVPENHDLYRADPLYMLREKNDSERRGVNGLLLNPPRVFVLHYNAKWGEVQSIETPWESVEVLAPGRLAVLCAAMEIARKSEWKVRAAEYKTATRKLPYPLNIIAERT